MIETEEFHLAKDVVIDEKLDVELVYNGLAKGYVACDDMIVGKTYTTEKKKINFRGDLVYMFPGIYGWKLASRFKRV